MHIDSKKDENNKVILYLSDKSVIEYVLDDIHLTEASKYAKKNMDLPSKTTIEMLLNSTIDRVDSKIVSHYTPKAEDYREEAQSSASNDENTLATENSVEEVENLNQRSEINEEVIDTPVEENEIVSEEVTLETEAQETQEEIIEEAPVIEAINEANPEVETIAQEEEINAPQEEEIEASEPIENTEEIEAEAVVEEVEMESLFKDLDDDNPFSDYLGYKARKAAKARENRANKKKKENSGFEQISIFDDLD